MTLIFFFGFVPSRFSIFIWCHLFFLHPILVQRFSDYVLLGHTSTSHYTQNRESNVLEPILRTKNMLAITSVQYNKTVCNFCIQDNQEDNYFNSMTVWHTQRKRYIGTHYGTPEHRNSETTRIISCPGTHETNFFRTWLVPILTPELFKIKLKSNFGGLFQRALGTSVHFIP